MRARVHVALFAALVASVSCTLIQPEVGDPRPACVDVDSDPTRTVSFKNDIRPLMNGAVVGTKPCRTCHYETADSTGGAAPVYTAPADPYGPPTLTTPQDTAPITREGLLETGLNLQTLGSLRKGGRNTPPGSIVVPGKPCSSAIVKKLQGTFGDARMPKEGPYWDPAKIQLVIDWIAEGAQGAETD